MNSLYFLMELFLCSTARPVLCRNAKMSVNAVDSSLLISCITNAANYSLQLNVSIKAMTLRDEINPKNCLFCSISKTRFGRTEFPQ